MCKVKSAANLQLLFVIFTFAFQMKPRPLSVPFLFCATDKLARLMKPTSVRWSNQGSWEQTATRSLVSSTRRYFFEILQTRLSVNKYLTAASTLITKISFWSLFVANSWDPDCTWWSVHRTQWSQHQHWLLRHTLARCVQASGQDGPCQTK